MQRYNETNLGNLGRLNFVILSRKIFDIFHHRCLGWRDNFNILTIFDEKTRLEYELSKNGKYYVGTV